MKNKLVLLAAPIAMLAASTAMAANFGGLTPYVGADAELRHMNFARDFGRELFSHNYPQANLYAGVLINEYLAVEAGYEATERRTRTSTTNDGNLLAGVRINTNIQANSTAQVKGLHANLVGFLPICEVYRLKLIGMVGFARLKANFVTTFTATAGNGILVDEIPGVTQTFTERKSVLRLGAGLQHMINCNWGVRAMVKWEQSNKLKMAAIEDSDFNLRANNSLIYSIGAFYTFN